METNSVDAIYHFRGTHIYAPESLFGGTVAVFTSEYGGSVTCGQI